MRFRRLIASGLPGLLFAAGVIAGPSSQAAAAASPCTVTYAVVNQWNTGFQGSITITNNAAPLTSWKLAFTFPSSGQVITQLWNGNVTQSGQQVTVTNASYNGSLGTGQSVNPGFIANYSGSNPSPTYFTLNGTACNGAAQLPTVSLTSPANNATFTAPATVHLAATAASTSGGTITKVQFFDGTTLLGTATSSPYTFTATNVAAGTHSLTAEAFDSSGTTNTSTAVTIVVRSAGGLPQLHVAGNKLVDAAGNNVVLHGVNRSGGEYACVQGNGLWDGPMDATAVAAIASWKGVNAVRVPLNEDCWQALSNVQPQFAGTNYQNAVKAYVNLLHADGLMAILDLHWTDGVYTGPSSSCSNATATCQKPMPDAANAIPFWTGVANAFKGDNATIFDLFNEPFPSRASGSNESLGWQCWRNGGSACVGIGYAVAGMQSMVNAVRGTGATNVIMLGGLEYANDETQWLASRPSDSTGNLVASFHSYNFNTCNNSGCWSSQIAPVIAQVPLVAGEIGENDCAHGYIDGLMSFLDGQGSSYLGWAWNADFDCSRGPGLISAYDGTPTNFGVGLKNHLASLP